MAGGIIVRKRKLECRAKVKMGCATCRIRKIKCDEQRPFCQKCIKTSRTCDGYESLFRVSTSHLFKSARLGGIRSDIGLRPFRPTSNETSMWETALLDRIFSTKTLFSVRLSCFEEAREILQASLTNPPVRQAYLSLRALREDLEKSGDDPKYVLHRSPIYEYGVQQYSMSLRGLASEFQCLGTQVLKLALLCCQIFISIEQVQKDYAAMAQHIIRGLNIMHEHRARPTIDTTNSLVAAHREQLPFLDVFLIKLFAAPCKFADPPATTSANGTALLVRSELSHQLIQTCDLPRIAPNMRTELGRIATSILEFLDKVTRVESVEVALQLLSERKSLLESLESWLVDLELAQKTVGHSGPELISVSFLRIFYLILKIIILGQLEFSLDLDADLRTENEQLLTIANDVGERVKAYVTCSGSNSVEEILRRTKEPNN